MDGVAVCARFMVNAGRALKSLSPDDPDRMLFDSLRGKRSLYAAKAVILGSNAVYQYLSLIGRHHKKDPFDKEVVKAYWLGNALSFSMQEEHIASLIKDLQVPQDVKKELLRTIPEKARPTHLSHLLHLVRAGASIHVDAMRIASARVIKIKRAAALIEYSPVYSPLRLAPRVKRAAQYHKKLCIPSVGDIVALHHGWIVAKLSRDQAAAMAAHTKDRIEKNTV